LPTPLPRRRWIATAFCATALAALAGGCSIAMLDTVGSVPETKNPQAMLDGRVYALRGMLGAVFSTGMDDLASELNSRGLRTTVHAREWQETAEQAIAEYKAAPQRRIMLVGHSDGADGVLSIASRLKEAGVPVALVITFDPTRVFSKPVPDNVERFINLYQSTNILGGGSSKRAEGFRGHYSNVNLREQLSISHVTIDKSRALHEAIIPKFLQVAAFGSTSPEGAVAIDYTIPNGEKIEIWDSGIAIRAENGDTAESLALRYGVPVWGIRRVNKLDDDAVIGPGQNLVIPRHLDASSAMARQLAGPPPATR
jgi:LysM repeat protein